MREGKNTQKKQNNKSILLFCGPSEADDLAAQIVADLCEADGWQVRFGGGGVPADEILAETNECKPDALCMFSSSPCDAPHIRNIIDTIKTVGASPHTQIVVGGGLFNRVEGLAEEIGADLWASSPADLKTKITKNGHKLPGGEKFLADYFNEAGYKTSYVGKWHLSGSPHCNRWVPEGKRGGFQDFIGWESLV